MYICKILEQLPQVSFMKGSYFEVLCNLAGTNKALRSAGGFRRPLRSLTRKNSKMRMKKRTERSTILGVS